MSATEQPATEDPAATDKEPDDVAGVVNLRKLAEVCFKYDPNSLVHGVFLEKIAGRLRHPRAISAFIEATGVGRADSGGVKFDRALPKPKVAGVDAKGGYGTVQFHRTEFTAKAITAYFSLDLSQIRGYSLSADATALMEIFSLWKVRKLLDSNMRLRSACELELTDGEKSIDGKCPKDFKLPSADEVVVFFILVMVTLQMNANMPWINSPLAVVLLLMAVPYIVFYMAFNNRVQLQGFGQYGDFSYGIYIYSFPIQQLFRQWLGHEAGFLGYTSMSFVAVLGAAVFSWHCVEKQFLRLKKQSLRK